MREIKFRGRRLDNGKNGKVLINAGTKMFTNYAEVDPNTVGQFTGHRYRELQRYRADKDPNKKTYISMTRPNDPNKCTLFWRETSECFPQELTDKLNRE